MIIHTKLDILAVMLTIITAGVLAGVIAVYYKEYLMNIEEDNEVEPDVQYSEVETETTDEVEVNDDENNQSDEANQQENTIDMALFQSTEGSNVRYKDGEKQYVGGGEFLESVKYNLNQEIKVFNEINIEA